MTETTIKTFVNESNGLKAEVFEKFWMPQKKYGVQLYDTDANEQLPSIHIFETMEKAEAFADRFVNS